MDEQFQAPPPYYGEPHGTAQQTPGTNGVAIAALVVGIVSLPLALFAGVGAIAGIVAIVLGVVGLRRAKAPGGSGKGMAIAGIVTGTLGLLLGAFIIASLVTTFSDPDVRQQIREEFERQQQLDTEATVTPEPPEEEAGA